MDRSEKANAWNDNTTKDGTQICYKDQVNTDLLGFVKAQRSASA